MQPKELQLSHQCPERRPAAFQKWYIKGADAEHGAARCGNTLPGYWAQALPRTGLHVPGKVQWSGAFYPGSSRRNVLYPFMHHIPRIPWFLEDKVDKNEMPMVTTDIFFKELPHTQGPNTGPPVRSVRPSETNIFVRTPVLWPHIPMKYPATEQES
ncbi:unnamed protein product [Cylicocyclus nassatus]|uniref:Uncharacterized protein n=1 Tax=Cylicocyclus nassatus TaxID=53992 RepID=A0AA36GYM8_CYLNA|nr:unnamed protein product [Cylicocyclus nassatus]